MAFIDVVEWNDATNDVFAWKFGQNCSVGKVVYITKKACMRTKGRIISLCAIPACRLKKNITVEGLLKACYIGSHLGYKFYESVREQCLFNALKEDLIENFINQAPHSGIMEKLGFQKKFSKSDAKLQDVIASIRDTYIELVSKESKKNIIASSMFGTKARLNLVLEAVNTASPNLFSRTVDILKNGVVYDHVIAYDSQRHGQKMQESDGERMNIDENVFSWRNLIYGGFYKLATFLM